MLVQFSVKNFRSIRDTQTLSMVADSSKVLEETNVLSAWDEKGLRLLPCAAIYGPNASGKSNIIVALNAMRYIVLNSVKLGQVGESIDGIEPHALAKNEPTEFEIIFLHGDIRYQYGFAATQERIYEEWLFIQSKRKRVTTQKWLERQFNPETQHYEFYINPEKVKGNREIWKNSTLENVLFLSKAASDNSEQFKPLLEWFRTNLKVGNLERLSQSSTFQACFDTEKKQHVLNFMNAADLSIADIILSEKEIKADNVAENITFDNLFDTFLDNLDKFITDSVSTEDMLKIKNVEFMHLTDKGEHFSLPKSAQSAGTQRLFNLAGFWLDALKNGYIMVVDELDDSLHPHLVHYLVKLFHDTEINTKNAQLIFTTHDTSVLEADILRRDQIWFLEKDNNHASQLYSLAEFKPRKEENLGKNYLQGRYGALPYVGEFPW